MPISPPWFAGASGRLGLAALVPIAITSCSVALTTPVTSPARAHASLRLMWPGTARTLQAAPLLSPSWRLRILAPGGSETLLPLGSVERDGSTEIQGIEPGENLLIVLEPLLGGTPLPGASWRTMLDLEPGSTATASFSPLSTAVGEVYETLLRRTDAENLLQAAPPASVSAYVRLIHGLLPVLPSWGRVDGRALAEALVLRDGELPPDPLAFRSAEATVDIRIKGVSPALPVTLAVLDPASVPYGATSGIPDGPDPLHRIRGVRPGTWPVHLAVHGMPIREATVSAPAGGTGRLDLDFSPWQAGPPLPVPIGGSSTVTLGGRIYVIGGMTVSRAATDSVWMLDTLSTSPGWVRRRSTSFPREGAAAGVLEGRIVVAGGLTTGNSGAPVPTRRVESYDPLSDRWTDLPDLPLLPFGALVPDSGMDLQGLASLSGAVIGQSLWVHAGVGIETLPATFLSALASGTGKSWSTPTTTGTATPRLFAASIQDADRWWLVGGRMLPPLPYMTSTGQTFEAGAPREDTEWLDARSGTPRWRGLAHALLEPRAEAAGVAHEQKLLVAGGVGHGRRPLGSVERLDPDIGWRAVGTLRQPRASLGLALAGGKVWAIGGLASRQNLYSEFSELPGVDTQASVVATDTVEFSPIGDLDL